MTQKPFEILEKNKLYTVNDRNICDIMQFDGNVDIAQERGSLWVTAQGTGTLDGDVTVGSGVWSAGGYSRAVVNGSGLYISNYGIQQNEKTLTRFNAEEPGQLVYIDGCSNSNIVAPQRNGDPCLNYLFFPVGINQTYHTHPSLRVGYVTSGRGWACISVNGKDEKIPLLAGTAFILNRHILHRFTTDDSHMSLVAYHPDSEDGPRDEANPMKTRTYIER